MPFATVERAREIERAELQLLLEGAGQSPTAAFLEVAGGAAVVSRPGSPLQKVFALGFEAITDEELASVEAFCAEHEVPTRIELSTLSDPDLMRRLTERGYRLIGFENLSGFDPSGPLPPTNEIEVREWEGERDPWIDVVVTGFCHPNTGGAGGTETFAASDLEPAIRDFTGTPSMRLFGAYSEGRLIGGGSLAIYGSFAMLTGAAVLPDARRRGGQSALLAHRLEQARDAGCSLVTVTTEPGSKSQQNLHRAGFQLLYSRAVLVKD